MWTSTTCLSDAFRYLLEAVFGNLFGTVFFDSAWPHEECQRSTASSPSSLTSSSSFVSSSSSFASSSSSSFASSSFASSSFASSSTSPFSLALVILAALGVYVLGWFILCTETPEIHGDSTSTVGMLLAQSPTIRGARPYRPPLLLFNPHIQMLYQEYIKQDVDVNYVRETLLTPDGGTISLDWVHEMPDYGTKDKKPLLLLLHGLTGGSHELYMKTLGLKFFESNWRIVAFNRRGCGNNKITSALVYTYTTSADVELVLQIIQKRLPSAPIYACGLSAGSNVLMKYLGQVGANTCIQAAVSVANAYDISLGTKTIQKNPLYNVIMAAKLKNLLLKAVEDYQFDERFNMKEIKRCLDVREFDEKFTRRYLGYDSLDEYYESQSCYQHLDNVAIPVMCLHSLDDPIVPPCLFPWEKWRQNSKISVVTTKRGGHLTWIQGLFFANKFSWMDDAIYEFLAAAHSAGPLHSRKSAACVQKMASLHDPHPNLRDHLLTTWTNKRIFRRQLNLEVNSPARSRFSHIHPYIPELPPELRGNREVLSRTPSTASLAFDAASTNTPTKIAPTTAQTQDELMSRSLAQPSVEDGAKTDPDPTTAMMNLPRIDALVSYGFDGAHFGLHYDY